MAVVRKLKGGKKRRDADDDDSNSSPKEKFKLETELTEPSDRLEDYIILITGEKKIGKTSLANMFGKKSYFLAFEAGYRGLRLRKTDIGPTEWKKAKLAANALRKAKDQYGPIVIDTVDKAYESCERFICEKLAINHLADEDWGKGYAECKKEFDNFITELSQIGVGLILISHTEEREIKTRHGDKYDKIMPTMSKQARKIIEPLVDIWTCYAYDGKKRVLIIEGDDHVSAGHRLTERFRSPEGKPIRQISMGKDVEEAYDNLVAAFNNEYEPEESDEDEAPKKNKKKLFKLKK
jgi:hypothetical protein